METWDELEQAVRMWPQAFRTTSTDAELDAFEAERGVRLPDSYREFAKTFGCCQLGQRQYLFERLIPSGDSGSKTGLAAYDAMMHSSAGRDLHRGADMPSLPGAEVGVRLVFFVHDVRGDGYGFDPGEVTDPATGECPIYVREVDTSRGYVRLASSLPELVLGFCLGEELAECREWVEAGGEPITFEDDDAFWDEDADPRILLMPN